VNIWLTDFNKHLTIAGFRGIGLKDIDKFFQSVKDETEGASVQFFDASLVAGWEHLQFAALNALNAIKGNVNISSSLSMETLLYASAQRQIKEAVKLMGIKPTTDRVAVLIIVDTQEQGSVALQAVSRVLGGRRDDFVLDLTDDKRAGICRLFNVSNVELEAKVEHEGAEKRALIDLVIEHMALLVTLR